MSRGSTFVPEMDMQRGAATNFDRRLDGTHAFERAGLGKAPFVCKGWSIHKNEQGQACGSCHFCGECIMYAAKIVSSDNKEFTVGSDCVAKIGDAGLVRAIKRSPEYREHQRNLRYARDERNQAEIKTLLDSLRDHPEKGAAACFIESVLRYCGMAGRARYLKELRALSTQEPAHV